MKTEYKYIESKIEEKNCSKERTTFYFSTLRIQVIEQAANERLLATISTSQVGQFTIESALERKYKLKLEVIPVIEDFANTPLENR